MRPARGERPSPRAPPETRARAPGSSSGSRSRAPRAAARSRPPRREAAPRHRDPPGGSGDPQVLDREPELAPGLIQQPEIEVAAPMRRLQLDGRLQRAFRLGEPSGLEEDQAEVRMKDLRIGVLLDQGSRRPRRL